jgi:serine O-acetyltransferase
MTLARQLRQDAIANGGKDTLMSILWLSTSHAGFQAILCYRIERKFIRSYLILRVLGRLFRIIGRCVTSCHINPRADIAGGLALPHATGIVIGEGVCICENVTIYQNATIGRGGSGHDQGYPTLGEGCVIYANACVVGPIRIGSSAVVGANSFVSRTVDDATVVAGVPARVVHM